MSDEFNYDVVANDPLEEAPEDAERGITKFPNPDPKESPVLPLGFLGGKVVFAMPEGEIRMEPAAKVGTMLRTDIFACNAGQAFLTNWRAQDDKFLRDLATVWFVRQCRAAGLWDVNRTVRSLGVWPGDATSIVLHLGDEVWRIKEKGQPEKLSIIDAMREKRGPLYRLRPPAPRPGKAASVVDGQWVRDTLDLWRFDAIGTEGLTGADVVAGWAMAAELGAIPPFRGHLMVNAMAGSGKTTLVQFVHAIQSAIAGDVVDSFTGAGLRNDLAGMARPVLLDEAESAPGTHGPGAVEQALELLRRMSTGQGGTRKQGDVGGGSVTQTAVGAVLLAAINPPRLGPADASRIVEVRLLPLAGEEGRRVASRAEVQAAITRAGELGPAILSRALKGAWRFRADVDELAAALVRAGESPRSADLVSMLAAGRRLLLFDTPLTPDEADAEVQFWRPLLAQREEAENVSNPGADALAHLMAADAGMHRGDRRLTVGDVLDRWMEHREDCDAVLKAHGLKLYEGQGPDGRSGPWLFVANHHPRLEAIFRSTQWADWRRTLAYLNDKGPEFRTWPTKKQRFGVGSETRALAVPLAPWFGGAIRPPAGVKPLPRSAAVPPSVPEEDVDWPS